MRDLTIHEIDEVNGGLGPILIFIAAAAAGAVISVVTIAAIDGVIDAATGKENKTQ